MWSYTRKDAKKQKISELYHNIDIFPLVKQKFNLQGST